MLFSEPGLDPTVNTIMFHNLSEEAQCKALSHMGAASAGDLDWDVFPIAYLPAGVIGDYEQDEIDLHALMQIGFYRL